MSRPGSLSASSGLIAMTLPGGALSLLVGSSSAWASAGPLFWRDTFLGPLPWALGPQATCGCEHPAAPPPPALAQGLAATTHQRAASLVRASRHPGAACALTRPNCCQGGIPACACSTAPAFSPWREEPESPQC